MAALDYFIGNTYANSDGALVNSEEMVVAVPAGAQEGDLILAKCAYVRGSSASSVGPVDMTGWTELGSAETSLAVSCVSTVYVRTATASETSYIFTKLISGSDRDASVELVVLRGVGKAGAVRAVNQGSGYVHFPAISTSLSGVAIRWWSFTGDKSSLLTSLAGAEFISQGTGYAFQETYIQEIVSPAPVSDIDTGLAPGTFNSSETLFFPLAVPTVDYTARKGSTVTVTHTLTAGGITSQTFNGETVALASQSGQIANVDFTDTITTSGVYTLTLGDGVTTQNFDVQYNVIGLTTNTIQKEGVSIGARTDVEMDVLDATGATVLGNLTGLTTDASGVTGQTIVPLGAVDDPVRVSGYSATAGIGFAFKTTLGLL